MTAKFVQITDLGHAECSISLGFQEKSLVSASLITIFKFEYAIDCSSVQVMLSLTERTLHIDVVSRSMSGALAQYTKRLTFVSSFLFIYFDPCCSIIRAMTVASSSWRLNRVFKAICGLTAHWHGQMLAGSTPPWFWAVSRPTLVSDIWIPRKFPLLQHETHDSPWEAREVPRQVDFGGLNRGTGLWNVERLDSSKVDFGGLRGQLGRPERSMNWSQSSGWLELFEGFWDLKRDLFAVICGLFFRCLDSKSASDLPNAPFNLLFVKLSIHPAAHPHSCLEHINQELGICRLIRPFWALSQENGRKRHGWIITWYWGHHDTNRPLSLVLSTNPSGSSPSFLAHPSSPFFITHRNGILVLSNAIATASVSDWLRTVMLPNDMYRTDEGGCVSSH
ncbi:hypothetical protein AKJ16_DCAP06824 [Drosera capensis]